MPLSVAIPLGILFLLGEAIFSGSEIAIISANRARLRALANEGNQGAQTALRLLETPEWLMGTILTCHNSFFVANVALATLAAIDLVGPRYGELVSIVVVIPFLVIFGEVVPKSYCQDRADTLAPILARVIWRARTIVYPVVWLMNRGILSVLSKGNGGLQSSPFVTRQELEVLVEEHSEGDLRAGERKMIGRIFSFGELDVANVMVPLVEVSAVGEDATIEEVIDRIRTGGHSSILVYKEEIHHIVGVVNAKDIIAIGDEARGPLRGKPELVRPPYFVPESKPADDLLEEMQREKVKLAVAVDEYGGCVGIVTMEDLVEEIVGEISDEYDVDEVRLFQRIADGKIIVDARMEVEAVREELSIPIPDGDYETLGGYLLEVFERIPKTGESVAVAEWTFIVTEATARQIESVRCEPVLEDAGGEEESESEPEGG
jgi:CBS domain containing-hemolysin-like protein